MVKTHATKPHTNLICTTLTGVTQLAPKKGWLNMFHLVLNLIISPKGKILARRH